MFDGLEEICYNIPHISEICLFWRNLDMRNKIGRALACLTLLAVLAGVTAVPASAAGFRDVPKNHWAAESIQRCVSLGFFQGKSPDTFGLGDHYAKGTPSRH